MDQNPAEQIVDAEMIDAAPAETVKPRWNGVANPRRTQLMEHLEGS